MRVAVTGSQGLVGRALCAELHARGHQVIRVVRDPDQKMVTAPDLWTWDPDKGLSMDALAQNALQPAEAWVTLHGAGIADAKWTPARKLELQKSRIDSTAKIVAQLDMQRNRGLIEQERLRVVAASAIGIYGNGLGVCNEMSPVANDFLGHLATEWESVWFKARPWADVVHPRLGVVLSPAGGALGRMLPVFQWGMGGALGHGRQIMSWIALGALVQLLVELVEARTELGKRCGPVNAVQGFVEQREFAKVLGRVLRRPTFLPTPSFVLKAIYGEMAEELLLSGRAVESLYYQENPQQLEPSALLEAELRKMLGV